MAVETEAIGDADADAVGCEAEVVAGDAETAEGAALPETAEASALGDIEAVGFGEPPPHATASVAVSPMTRANAERSTRARSDVGTGLLRGVIIISKDAQVGDPVARTGPAPQR